MAKEKAIIPLEEIDFNNYIYTDSNSIFESGNVNYIRIDSTFPNKRETNKKLLIHILKYHPEIKYVMIAKTFDIGLYTKVNDSDFNRMN